MHKVQNQTDEMRNDMPKEEEMNVALIAGVTGLVGNALAENLVNGKWKVYGVARAPHHHLFSQSVAECIHLIACDLGDREDTLLKLSTVMDVTHVFWVTWAAHFTDDSLENYYLNRNMFSNALDALLPNAKALKHICLQTGTKHYHALGFPIKSDSLPLEENTPRLPNAYNFYYGLEDVMFEAVKKREGSITWSVHRPGLIFGQSARSFFNVMGSLAVYATLCKELGMPFRFPGSRACWEEPGMDASDAQLIAEQQVWAAIDARAHNQAFNTINGDVFTWKQMWPVLAQKFQLPLVMEIDESVSLVDELGDKGPVWDEIVRKQNLFPTRMEDIADWWFLDVLFKIPFKLLASNKKAREHGFHMTIDTQKSIGFWIEKMREKRLIP